MNLIQDRDGHNVCQPLCAMPEQGVYLLRGGDKNIITRKRWIRRIEIAR
jgi:hypothetical protein